MAFSTGSDETTMAIASNCLSKTSQTSHLLKAPIVTWMATTEVQSLLISRKMVWLISRKIFWLCSCDEWHKNLLLVFSAIFRVLITIAIIKLQDYRNISPVYLVILYKEVQFNTIL